MCLMRFLLMLMCSASVMMSYADPLILIQIPTRARPTQFFETLDEYERNLSGQVQCQILVTCDNDDLTMNNATVIKRLSSYPNVKYIFADNQSRVDAYNKGLDKFDILIVASDDRMPTVACFDKKIAEQFITRFPTLDGVVVYRTGPSKSDQDSVLVVGHDYYERFAMLLNPAYRELYAVQELLSVAKMLRKCEVSPEKLFCHKHSCQRTRTTNSEAIDKQTFMERRARMFDLSEDQLREAGSKDWSILICTMYERQESFKRLYTKLQDQINQLGLEDRIEILYYLDNRGEHSIGNKRNWLLQHSDGYYINFIDDDDDVSDDYIKVIYDALMQNPDSVSLRGLIAFSKQDIRLFIHSIKYNRWFEQNRIYYRPPNHLNTIKRYVGVQFMFPDISNGEDADWSMQIANAGLIKTEVDVQTPYYYYLPSYCHGKIDFSCFKLK